MLSVFDTLKQAAEQWSDDVAIIDSFGETTYQQLFDKTIELALFLKENGLRKGQGLGFFTGNNHLFLLALYSGVYSDVVVMPVAHQLKDSEVSQALKEAALHWLLTDNERQANFYEPKATITLSETKWFLCRTKKPLQEPVAEFVPGAAFMRFTSGTTGKAKGVIISNASVLQRIAAANEGLKLTHDDRVVWVLPMAYHFVVSLVLYIRYGVCIIVNDTFPAADILESIHKYKGTLLYAAPMHIKLMAHYKGTKNAGTLKHVISTTTSIAPEVCKLFEECYHIPVSQAYGIIEIGLPIINFQKSHEHPEAVGYALPAYEVGILDGNNKILPDATMGLLAIRGPGMFDGYLSPPTKKEDVLIDGWFLTGDYALKQSDGLILIKGRAKNVINVSGNKVFPEEVEHIVCKYEGVVAAKAYSKMHPLLGEIVAVSIVPDKKSIIDTEDLIRYCKKYLSDFKLPQFVEIVNELPVTATGKIKRT